MILQVLRRTVQASVLLVMVSIAFMSLYAHYRSARVIDDDQLMAGMRGEVVTKLIYPYIDALDNPTAFLDGNKGTLWSMKLFGVDLTDPLAAAEMLATSKHIHWPLLISIVIPVVVTLILGRVFCSWICPGYVLFEIASKLRKLLRFAEIQPANVSFSHRNKYIFLFVGLVVAAVCSAPLFALIYPPAVISRIVHAWVFGTALSGMLVLVSVLVAIEVFISPRWWCRTICPGGALYGLLGWLRPIRVKLSKSKCTGCMDCLPVCEAGINPITQSSSIECDNCGVCIRYCGDKALYFTIGLPGQESSSQKIATRATSKAAMFVMLIVPLLGPSTVEGHHILGLPHYSYKENYPQRPTLEYPATTGPYDVLLTSYPGIPVPGEAANIAIYIKNRETRKVYSEPITIRVLQTSTFGDNIIILPSTTRTPFDNEYKIHVTLPIDSEYIVEVSMPVEGRVEVIPFLIVAGQPTALASMVIVGSFSVIIVFVVIRAIHKKRQRKRRMVAGVDHGHEAYEAGSVMNLGEKVL